jgi:hypothetical protein
VKDIQEAFELEGEIEQNSSESIVDLQSKDGLQEKFQKTFQKLVEAKTSSIGRGSREVGRKTGSQMVNLMCALGVI